MTSAAPTSAPTTAAVELNRRQRDMVAASLRCVPGAARSMHRRWA
jgi:hypothetical protein